MKPQVKKNAVDLTDLAIGIVVLGIVVSIGSLILLNLRDGRLDELPLNTTTNESIATISSAGDGTALANRWYTGLTSAGCTNATGVTIESANYTTSVDSFGTGYVKNTTNTETGIWLCNYNHRDIGQADWALADQAATGLAEYGNWFKIIIIVGIAAVILALIFMAFGNGRGAEVGGTY